MNEDTFLIDQVLSEDRTAFNKLIAKYYPECLRKAKQMVKDADLAQDLLQTACMQAYFCLSNLKDKSLFRFWLLGIVKNVVNNYLKKRQHSYLSLENYSQQLQQVEENKDIQAVREIVCKHIDSLTPVYKKIIELFYFEDKNIKQIAQECDLSIETVKVRLHRGRQSLKQALQDYTELYHYHQLLKQRQRMKKVRIVDIIIGTTNQEHCSILLQEEDNLKVFLIIIATSEAMEMVMALKHIDSPRPSVFTMTASLIKAHKLQMDSIYIYDIIDGVFVSSIKVGNGKKLQEFDARPSDALTFALLFDSPIYVSEKVVDQVGFPVPEKYRHTPAKEIGIATLISVVEERNRKLMPDKVRAKAKTQQELQQAVDKVIEFTFKEA
ncbi:DUF151 domain-containing protein [Rhodocytophaga aerolata]|uniref:DUF151 domain-containing protein n=1 Tax=Rhodocytophaga aerolata TaxID=455078 RepID=A0ABT8RJ08_9BACT|nr:bifunctional nuclease domain-containing protein [Rhodocytophaga aerolata]MDO1450820.1 DUF151 domain-containing protein [Rhodocytophaga aerolata]